MSSTCSPASNEPLRAPPATPPLLRRTAGFRVGWSPPENDEGPDSVVRAIRSGGAQPMATISGTVERFATALEHRGRKPVVQLKW